MSKVWKCQAAAASKQGKTCNRPTADPSRLCWQHKAASAGSGGDLVQAKSATDRLLVDVASPFADTTPDPSSAQEHGDPSEYWEEDIGNLILASEEMVRVLELHPSTQDLTETQIRELADRYARQEAMSEAMRIAEDIEDWDWAAQMAKLSNQEQVRIDAVQNAAASWESTLLTCAARLKEHASSNDLQLNAEDQEEVMRVVDLLADAAERMQTVGVRTTATKHGVTE